MKYFLLLGGFAGFILVLLAGFYAGNRPVIALRDAAVGCVVGSMLFRLLHASFISGLKSRISERNKLEPALMSDDEERNSRVH